MCPDLTEAFRHKVQSHFWDVFFFPKKILNQNISTKKQLRKPNRNILITKCKNTLCVKSWKIETRGQLEEAQ